MQGIPALIVCLITAIFAILVCRQFIHKRRLNLGFWMVSLVLSAVGSLGYCLALWQVPHPGAWFEVYYLGGAMWMPCLMGLGSLGLVFRARTVSVLFTGVLLLGLFGSVELIRSPVRRALLQQLNGGAGTGVILERPEWLIALIVLNTFGAAAVIWVAVVSAIRTRQRRAPARFLEGNLWLACGVLIISFAGSAARLGWPSLFWVVMLIGWVGVFVGYCLLTPLTGIMGSSTEGGKRRVSWRLLHAMKNPADSTSPEKKRW